MTIRWGILGCGDVTEFKSGPAFQQAAGSELVAVMRRTGSLAEDYARRHNVPRWYDDAAALIADPEVDAVYVATPPGSHRDYALQVAAAGKPAYVEKPMARCAAECQEMVAAFAAANLPLLVAYYRRELPRFLHVKQLLEAGTLGPITTISYRFAAPREKALDPLPWRLDAAQSGGGLFFDVGSHVLDLLDFYFGPLGEISGLAAHRGKGYDVEDTIAMHFRTNDGVPGTAHWDFAGSEHCDLLTIAGQKGTIAVSVFDERPLAWEQEGKRELIEAPNPSPIQQPLVQTVVDQLLGQGSCCSTGESAARTAELMDQVVAEYYGGRDPGFWDQPERWPGRRKPA